MLEGYNLLNTIILQFIHPVLDRPPQETVQILKHPMGSIMYMKT